MPEACLDSWQPYGCEWSVGYLWRSMSWPRRLDLIVLALMLAYVVFVSIRVSCHYRLSRCTLETDITDRSRRKLSADLSVQLGILAAIASAAPYLGAVGTCVGIMGGSGMFAGINMEANTFKAMMALHIASALFTTAAGILVAVPATWAYNYLRVRVDLLKNIRPHNFSEGTNGYVPIGEKLGLRKPFSHLSPYPLIAATCLAALVALCTPFFSPRRPTGLGIELGPARCEFDRVTRLHVTDAGKVLLNEEPLEWNTLGARLSEIYSVREERTLNLLIADDVPFQTAADTIDIIENAPISGGTASLHIRVRLMTPAGCSLVAVRPLAIHSSRHVPR